MMEKNLALDVVAYNVLINCLCKIGKFDETQGFLEEMKDAGLAADLATYNTMINAHCKEGNIEKAFKITKEMRSNGLISNVITYNSLMARLCERGDSKGNRFAKRNGNCRHLPKCCCSWSSAA